VFLRRILLKERQSPLAILMLMRVLAVHTPLRKFVPDSTQESFLGRRCLLFLFVLSCGLLLYTLHAQLGLRIFGTRIIGRSSGKIEHISYFRHKLKNHLISLLIMRKVCKNVVSSICAENLKWAQNVHLIFQVRALLNCDLVRDGCFLPAKAR
jgi:hypothetical protein